MCRVSNTSNPWFQLSLPPSLSCINDIQLYVPWICLCISFFRNWKPAHFQIPDVLFIYPAASGSRYDHVAATWQTCEKSDWQPVNKLHYPVRTFQRRKLKEQGWRENRRGRSKQWFFPPCSVFYRWLGVTFTLEVGDFTFFSSFLFLKQYCKHATEMGLFHACCQTQHCIPIYSSPTFNSIYSTRSCIFKGSLKSKSKRKLRNSQPCWASGSSTDVAWDWSTQLQGPSAPVWTCLSVESKPARISHTLPLHWVVSLSVCLLALEREIGEEDGISCPFQCAPMCPFKSLSSLLSALFCSVFHFSCVLIGLRELLKFISELKHRQVAAPFTSFASFSRVHLPCNFFFCSAFSILICLHIWLHQDTFWAFFKNYIMLAYQENAKRKAFYYNWSYDYINIGVVFDVNSFNQCVLFNVAEGKNMKQLNCSRWHLHSALGIVQYLEMKKLRKYPEFFCGFFIPILMYRQADSPKLIVISSLC